MLRAFEAPWRALPLRALEFYWHSSQCLLLIGVQYLSHPHPRVLLCYLEAYTLPLL